VHGRVGLVAEQPHLEPRIGFPGVVQQRGAREDLTQFGLEVELTGELIRAPLNLRAMSLERNAPAGKRVPLVVGRGFTLRVIGVQVVRSLERHRDHSAVLSWVKVLARTAQGIAHPVRQSRPRPWGGESGSRHRDRALNTITAEQSFRNSPGSEQGSSKLKPES
jgi:hypothetical protein